MEMANLLSIMKIIVILIIVLLLANVSLKNLNKYMKKQNKIIRIIERISVSNNSSISIVDICGKYYIMSFTETENKILKELDDEEVRYIDALGILNDCSMDKLNMENKNLGYHSIFEKLGNLFEMRKNIE